MPLEDALRDNGPTHQPPVLSNVAVPLDQMDKLVGLLHHFEQNGWVVIDQLYHDQHLHQLAAECVAQDQHLRAAAIQHGVMPAIRSDQIAWIDERMPLALQHVQLLEWLGQWLNRAFFMGIRQVEAHYACYQPGQFYGLHRDNPQQRNGRVVSSVFYPHLHWCAEWQGQLRLQDQRQRWHLIQPLSNRLVLFDSNLLHEVLPPQQVRRSITAWLRAD